ncbi:MAG: SPOR domain-containing protein [Legionellales bacterium]|nr:SPOR domain-containing protein [Legionellales bacterium]
MLKITKLINLILWSSCLASCVTDSPPPPTVNEAYLYGPQWSYATGFQSAPYTMSEQDQPITLPDNHPVLTQHPPTPHQNLDRDWVKNQNAQNYTIQVADDEKPSAVAGKLYKAPKQERTAEVKILQDGKTSYKGLYGTYPNLKAALQALDELPPDVKQNADIKTWGSVQSGISE